MHTSVTSTQSKVKELLVTKITLFQVCLLRGFGVELKTDGW